MSEWQPIDTAPKDGRSVIVFDYYETDGTRLPDGRLKQTGRDGLATVVARYTEMHGWHVSSSVIGGAYIGLRNPKRWMPLPAPPKESSDAAE